MDRQSLVLRRLFVVGDSISIHYGPYLQRMLEGVCLYDRKSDEGEALLDLDRPQGANGGDSSMVRDYLSALDRRGDFHTDVLLLNCGLHDVKTDPTTGVRQVSLDQYQVNLRAIVALARRPAALVVWARTTPVDDEQHNSLQAAFHRFGRDVENYNGAADEVMREAGVPEIDLFGFTRGLGGREVYCDHVHFVEAVRAQQAAYIAGYLSRLLQSRG